MSKPLRIHVDGEATIYHPAERAVIFIDVRATGTSQEEVSHLVISTAATLKATLTSMAPKTESGKFHAWLPDMSRLRRLTTNLKGEATADATVTHWSNASLSTSSWRYKPEGETQYTRQFRASTKFEAKFRDFEKLASFATTLSNMPKVYVQNIEWRLTEKTKKNFNTEIRRQAIHDAVHKAQDYSSALGRGHPRALEVRDQDQPMAPLTYHHAMRADFGAPGSESSAGHEELSFEPESLPLSCKVAVQFEVE